MGRPATLRSLTGGSRSRAGSKTGDRNAFVSTFKIVVVGGGGVGKSSITIQFIQVSAMLLFCRSIASLMANFDGLVMFMFYAHPVLFNSTLAFFFISKLA